VAPVDSDPVTGSVTVALNPPDGQRGYVGIELTRAPVAPGGYYLAVRSVGSTPYRIRPAAHLFERSLPEHELEGSFAFFTVLGGEILDENFQRVEAFQVDQPKIAYVRMSDPTEVEDTIVVTFETFDEGDGLVDRIDTLTLTRVGRSAVFLSPPIELHPGFTEASGAQAMASGPPKTRTAPKGRAKVRNPSRDVAKTVTRWGDTYLVPFGLTLPLRVYQSLAFNHLVTPPRHYICSPPAGDCPLLENLLRDPASVQMTITLPAGADAEGERQLARMELEPGPQPEAGWYLRGIRMTMDGAGQPMTWSDGTVRAPEGRITVKATSPTLAELATARVAVSRPSALGCCATASCPLGPCKTLYPRPANTVVDLEPLVIDEADRWGIPPHYLMAQLMVEAGPDNLHGWPNAYAFRYEANYDFRYLTGDTTFAKFNRTRKLFDSTVAASNLLTTNGGGKVQYLPCETAWLSGEACADQDEVSAGLSNAALEPDFEGPTGATFRLTEPGQPHALITDAYLRIEIRTDIGGTPTLLTQVYPQADQPKRPSTAMEYEVNGITSKVQFGGPWPRDTAFDVKVRRIKINEHGLSAFPRGGTNVPNLQTIREFNPPGNLVPPPGGVMTLTDWMSLPLPQEPIIQGQGTSRYGEEFSGPNFRALMRVDPSFRYQAQWYANASYGLMQIMPDGFANRFRGNNGAFDSATQAEVFAIYNPTRDNPEKLFNPATCIKLGAMMDAKAEVERERDGHQCAAALSACTWDVLWRRRLCAFNTGIGDNSCDYATKVLDGIAGGFPGAAAFVPNQ
jgi:hypothetical protein